MQVLLVSILVLGLLYSLQALSFVLVIRGTGILNFAQGQILALGAYLFFALHRQLGGGFGLSFVLMLLASGVLGVALYTLVLKPMEGGPLWSVVMALFGVGIVIDSAVQMVWGSEPKFLPSPVRIQPIGLPGGFRTGTLDLLIAGVTVVSILALFLVIYGTPLGLRMRASADNKVLASYAGVNVSRVAQVSWVLASMFASLAGLAIALRTTVSPALSLAFLTAFPAVLVGGFESIAGAVVGAFVLALILQVGVTYIGSAVALPLAYAVLLVMLVIRPQGLFGARDIVRV